VPPLQLPFQPGDLIGGRYRLIRMIGAGAMGAVWSARNESTDRDFALKLMLPDSITNPVALQRFFQEAKASGRLRHRCIVEVYDLGRIEQLAGAPTDPRAGTPYLVMELLEGEALDTLLRRVSILPFGTALKIVADVARALEIAHQQRIVHRDLKPGNLFLHKSLDGPIVPKILDFGISKLTGPNHDPMMTSAGTVLGSPAYMSPEQASGELDVDGRSDVWSLGVILYKCLCGAVPFSAPNYNALMMAITNSPPKPIGERVPGLPPAVAEIVHTCLAKRRENRFPSAKALSEAIDKVLARTNLPTIDLATIIAAPVELLPDDAKTVAAERSQGTLAATEIDDQAETRAIDSGSSQNAIAPYGSQAQATTAPRKSAPPPFAAKMGRKVWMIAGGVGFVALATIIGIAATHKSEDSSPAKKDDPPAFATPEHPNDKDKDKDPTEMKKEAPKASVAATTTASASASATQTATVAIKAPTTPPKYSPPITKKPDPKPATATAKPANEGVTGAGF